MMSALQLLKYANLSNEEKRLVELAEQTGKHQVDTVDNVLELSSITNSSMALDVSIINPSRHIEQVVETLAFTAHQKGIEIYCIFHHDFPVCIRTDATRINHMLSNIINSVYRYCSISELVIRSSCKLLKNAAAELRIDVISDIASDIPQNYQDIFDALNAAHSVDTGMRFDFNLAISKNIARCMGGNLGIDYQPERKKIIFWFAQSARISLVWSSKSS